MPYQQGENDNRKTLHFFKQRNFLLLLHTQQEPREENDDGFITTILQVLWLAKSTINTEPMSYAPSNKNAKIQPFLYKNKNENGFTIEDHF